MAGPDLPHAAYGHCIVQIDDDQFFFAAGHYTEAAAHVYDWTAGTWSGPKASMTQPRAGAACGVYDDGTGNKEVVVAGGRTSDPK